MVESCPCRQLNEMATLTATAQDRTAMKAKNELWTAHIKLYRSLEGFWRPDYAYALAEKGEKASCQRLKFHPTVFSFRFRTTMNSVANG